MCSTPDLSAADVQALADAAPGPAVITALAALQVAGLDGEARLLLVTAWEAQQHWLAAQSAAALAALAGPEPTDTPAREADDWLREDLRVALRLSAGQISHRHASAVCEAVAALPDPVATAVQDKVLPAAPRQTLAQLRRALARAVIAADPRTADAQHTAATAERRVVLYPEPAEMATLAATLPADQAQRIWAALTRAAARTATPDGPRIDARRADALLTLCTAAPAPARPRADVHVVIDLPTLLDLAQHPAQLTGYGPIPPAMARALAADATWRRLLVEPRTGRALDLGTTRYRPTRALRDLITTRHPTCTFPVCGTPATTCDLDHARAHHRDGTGGPTSAHNLHPACRRHHRLKTHGGWTITTTDDGAITWTNPHGHPHTTEPHNYLDTGYLDTGYLDTG